MTIFTCKDAYEDMMTCIYAGWEWALKNGHENLRLMKEPIEQPSLFDQYIHIKKDREKSLKVTRSIVKKLSIKAYIDIYNVLLFYEDRLDDVYRYLRLGFKAGSKITDMLTEPIVMKISKISKSVSNEASLFREFARFNSVDNKVYICHLEPKSNVVYYVATHFQDRMPSENWIIIDDNRKLAVVHPKNEKMYLTYLDDKQFERLSESERLKDEYTTLWQTFFDSIAIKQRENYNCQRGHFPIWMRKHTVEFNNNTYK